MPKKNIDKKKMRGSDNERVIINICTTKW